MANITGPQPDIRYCPVCRGTLRNLERNELPSRGYVRRDGTVAEHTHSYECTSDDCHHRFEINQAR